MRMNGFTVIELVVVIVIISILALQIFQQTEHVTPLDAAAQQVADDIRLAQNLASNNDQIYYLRILSSNTYSIYNATNAAQTHPYTKTTVINLPTSATFGTLTNLPNSLIAFDSYAQPYINSTATTALTNNAQICITYIDVTKCITINPQTGFVSV